MIVCCAVQENGARTNGLSILTGIINLQFSRIRSSMMPDPNSTKFIVLSTQGRPQSKFEGDSFSHSQDTSNQTFERVLFCVSFLTSSFCTLCKVDIACVFVAEILYMYWGLKTNISIKFGINLINIQGVISYFTIETKSRLLSHLQGKPLPGTS